MKASMWTLQKPIDFERGSLNAENLLKQARPRKGKRHCPASAFMMPGNDAAQG